MKSLPPEYTALAAKVNAALVRLNGLGDDPQPAQILALLGQAQSVYLAVNAANGEFAATALSRPSHNAMTRAVVRP